jgi:hypothetical protein
MQDEFLRIVPHALSYVYRLGTKGHWSDVRSTAEVLLALVASGESLQAPHFRYAGEYLVSAFGEEAVGGSWGSELWDTSMAVRALGVSFSNGKPVIDRAFEWIWTKIIPDGSIDGEPWDTLFVCLAALENGRSQRLLSQNSLEWLCSLQSQEGILISPHYTGLFCEVIGKVLEVDLPSQARQRYREAATRALHALWDRYDPKALWGTNTWANAYIIEGVTALKHGEFLKEYDSVMNWYEARQTEEGAWDDVVRTAIVIRALCHLKFAYEFDRSIARPLQVLSFDFYSRSMQAEITKAIHLNTVKAPIVRTRRLIEKDEIGNRVITLTPEREIYLGVAAILISLIWALLTNWPFLKGLLRL